MNNEYVVYSCVTHNYDMVRPIPSTLQNTSRFVCFSDRPSRVPNGWEGRQLQSPPRLKAGHDSNRFHKLFCHRVLPEYRYSVYIDGNISFGDGYSLLVDKMQSAGLALGAFRHSERRNVEQEVEACRERSRFDQYDLDRMYKQLEVYGEDGFDVSQPISSNNLLVRDHKHPLLAETMSIWWSHLFEFTKRDQISLGYALWKTGLPWGFLDMDCGVSARSLHWQRHNRTPGRIVMKAWRKRRAMRYKP